jgi:aryl-phospho-beta-D-glucosidase BglC (GH1 family)
MVLVAAGLSISQTLPTAKSIAAEMTLGWNLGNSMESSGGPTNWGNPMPTQALIDSMKAEGFNTIRIPSAWDANADPTTHVISASWMAQVKTVVDYCIKDSLFAILNIHWDDGWLENKIDSSVTNAAMRQTISAKQGAYWRQIATTFRNYDRHLLFASANEPNVADSASMRVLNSYHQIFIDTVRATGGNNASRTLVVQGPNADIGKTNSLMTTMPTDKSTTGRIMAEVHFYPYQFCLMTDSANWGTEVYPFYYWGKGNHSTTDTKHNPTWGEETWTDSMFTLMKTQFVDKNIPVVLGEFGAVKRLTLTGNDLALHLKSRLFWYNYVVNSAKGKGLIPIPWDAGGKGDGTMSVVDRSTNGVYDQDLLTAIRTGAGLPAVRVATTSIATRAPTAAAIFTTVSNGSIHATYVAKEYGKVHVTLTNLLGETIWSSAANAQAGMNSLDIPATQRGLAVLRIQQGNTTQQEKVYCP